VHGELVIRHAQEILVYISCISPSILLACKVRHWVKLLDLRSTISVVFLALPTHIECIDQATREMRKE
jgi:hypothetical protein